MELGVLTADGKESKVTVSDANFGVEFNEGLVHQVVTAYMAAARAGTSAQKSRSDVRGGGKKPWRQKGTGRARAGTIRSPIWRSGGVTFAARPRSYAQKVNRKMYRAAFKAILSELVRQERLTVIDEIKIANPKTKELVNKLKQLNIETSVLIVTEKMDATLELAGRNIHTIGICQSSEINPVSLIQFEQVLITAEALKNLEERLV
ncbi:MAG: 50S ribosomal protein L4 [Gammaproteobacteria bacterium]|nr:50S ribosomal protein L4 [Gammaproteobacteria bacterium]